MSQGDFLGVFVPQVAEDDEGEEENNKIVQVEGDILPWGTLVGEFYNELFGRAGRENEDEETPEPVEAGEKSSDDEEIPISFPGQRLPEKKKRERRIVLGEDDEEEEEIPFEFSHKETIKEEKEEEEPTAGDVYSDFMTMTVNSDENESDDPQTFGIDPTDDDTEYIRKVEDLQRWWRMVLECFYFTLVEKLRPSNPSANVWAFPKGRMQLYTNEVSFDDLKRFAQKENYRIRSVFPKGSRISLRGFIKYTLGGVPVSSIRTWQQLMNLPAIKYLTISPEDERMVIGLRGLRLSTRTFGVGAIKDYESKLINHLKMNFEAFERIILPTKTTIHVNSNQAYDYIVGLTDGVVDKELEELYLGSKFRDYPILISNISFHAASTKGHKAVAAQLILWGYEEFLIGKHTAGKSAEEVAFSEEMKAAAKQWTEYEIILTDEIRHVDDLALKI